jgi:hypothetical protein
LGAAWDNPSKQAKMNDYNVIIRLDIGHRSIPVAPTMKAQ